MADGAPAVLHGFGHQCWRTDHVADAIDVGDNCLTVLITGIAPLSETIMPTAERFKSSILACRPRATSIFCVDCRSIAQLRDNVRNLVPSYLFDMLSAEITAAVPFKAFDELFSQFSIHKLKWIGSAIDQGSW